jgi:hypothetical protein
VSWQLHAALSGTELSPGAEKTTGSPIRPMIAIDAIAFVFFLIALAGNGAAAAARSAIMMIQKVRSIP